MANVKRSRSPSSAWRFSSRCAASCGRRARRWRKASCSSSPSGCWPATSRTATSCTSTVPGACGRSPALFKVFGVSLLTERLFGLGQQMLVVFGVYALARPWGRVLAVACALTSALILVPSRSHRPRVDRGARPRTVRTRRGTARAPGRPDSRRRDGGRSSPGCSSALALLFRPDLVLALGIAAIPVLRGLDRRRVERMLIGAALGIAPMLIHVLTAGPGTVVDGMILEPIFDLRGGRSLPDPARLVASRRLSATGRSTRDAFLADSARICRAATVPLVLRVARSRGVPARRRTADAAGAIPLRSTRGP